jgi:hypothetical protein
MIVIYQFSSDSYGFGDLLRGLISMKQIQKRVGFELLIDVDKYFLSDYLEHSLIQYESQKKLEFFYGEEYDFHDSITEKIRNSQCDILTVTTNAYPRMNGIDDEIKQFIKDFFIFKPEFEEYMKHKLLSLPEKYHLFHYRLGDNEFVNASDEKKVYIEHFDKNKKDSSVLISDSFIFKEKIAETNKDVFVFLNQPIHTNKNLNTDKIQMMDTMVDFFLIQNAQSINCYSVYRWISNFVLWTSIIYDIPLHNIK